jgi:hypothetical protein
VRGTETLVAAAERAGVDRIVFGSSPFVHGPEDFPHLHISDAASVLVRAIEHGGSGPAVVADDRTPSLASASSRRSNRSRPGSRTCSTARCRGAGVAPSSIGAEARCERARSPVVMFRRRLLGKRDGRRTTRRNLMAEHDFDEAKGRVKEAVGDLTDDVEVKDAVDDVADRLR